MLIRVCILELYALSWLLHVPSYTLGFLTESIKSSLRNGEYQGSSLYSTNHGNDGRRSFLATTTSTLATLIAPTISSAGIDVSGLQAGSTGVSGSLSDQLKVYDGSATSRVQETKKLQAPAPSISATSTVPRVPKGVATVALRTTNLPPFLRKTNLGTTVRLEDQLLAPESSKFRSISVSVEFPSDWLQLDRLLGGLEYVDQRNGDKWYILRSELPSETTLETVPKKWFGESIFDAQGSFAKGNTIEDYKVSSSQLSSIVGACQQGGGACQYPRRRLGVKYATVTGNGLRVERRALVDAYEVDGVAYMLMVTQNAVKFEGKGRERETVEAIVDSFRLDR